MGKTFIILFSSFFFLATLLLSEHARSMGTKTYRNASAICANSKRKAKKEVSISNQKVCRTKSEHEKILQWSCKSKKGTLQKITFKEECPSK